MKLDAHVGFNSSIAKEIGKDSMTVTVDADYVESDESQIKDWIANELEEMFGRAIMLDDFTVTNMDELVEDIAYDEFKDKID